MQSTHTGKAKAHYILKMFNKQNPSSVDENKLALEAMHSLAGRSILLEVEIINPGKSVSNETE